MPRNQRFVVCFVLRSPEKLLRHTGRRAGRCRYERIALNIVGVVEIRARKQLPSTFVTDNN